MVDRYRGSDRLRSLRTPWRIARECKPKRSYGMVCNVHYALVNCVSEPFIMPHQTYADTLTVAPSRISVCCELITPDLREKL